MATELYDLDLLHPWELSTPDAIDMVIECEDAARQFNAKISNSEGASLSSHQGVSVYGNSHGFLASYAGTRHSLSCSVIASSEDDMQRDYWYTIARDAAQLSSASDIGQRAAQRAVERLNPRKVKTQKAKVLYLSLIHI